MTTAGQRTRVATVLLVAVTAIFGSTFFLIKDLLRSVSPSDFLAVRFSLAAVVMVVVFQRQLRALGGRDVAVSVVLGLLYGTAQVLQTIGLAHTSASVSGFVTGMYVVLTPILAGVLLRERVRPVVWLAVALSTAGLAVLSLQGRLTLGYGESLTLACAALYALHIVGLGRWSRVSAATGMSVVQIVIIAAVAWVAALSDGSVHLPPSVATWASMLYMVVFASVFVLWAQTWAQAHMSAPRAAIVMTFEPVFAAVFAVAFGGESFTVRMLIGGALVVGAMFVVELGAPPGNEAVAPEVLHHEGA